MIVWRNVHTWKKKIIKINKSCPLYQEGYSMWQSNNITAAPSPPMAFYSFTVGPNTPKPKV